MSVWYSTCVADFIYSRTGASGADLTTNTAPNSATPPEGDVFPLPRSDKKQSIMGLVAVGGTATVVVWGYSPSLNTWYQIASQALNNPGVMVFLGVGINTVAIPDAVPCYLQLSAVGTGCKSIGCLAH